MATDDKSQAFVVVGPGIQAGTSQKTGQTLQIPFPKPFTGNPVVVVTPYWELQSSWVPTVETIVAVNSENFTVSSGNQAPSNYYINWVAYGTL